MTGVLSGSGRSTTAGRVVGAEGRGPGGGVGLGSSFGPITMTMVMTAVRVPASRPIGLVAQVGEGRDDLAKRTSALPDWTAGRLGCGRARGRWSTAGPATASATGVRPAR